MTPATASNPARGRVWRLVERQHGVLTRAQLVELGYSAEAIRHRMRGGRLHALHRGVYAVGRRELPTEGRWMAAVLAAGPEAVLSHGSAAALWGIEREGPRIELSVPRSRSPRRSGLSIHRRRRLGTGDRTRRRGLPVTTPARTLIDLAVRLSERRLEAAVNAATKSGLTDPDALRAVLAGYAGEHGAAAMRRLLDPGSFALTDSELERIFLRIARRAGLPKPETGALVEGLKLDFLWRGLRLVIETDGLAYHRTPAQQGRDRLRDQTLTAAGLTVLRFTYAQVRDEPDAVSETLRRVVARLSSPAGPLGLSPSAGPEGLSPPAGPEG